MNDRVDVHKGTFNITTESGAGNQVKVMVECNEVNAEDHIRAISSLIESLGEFFPEHYFEHTPFDDIYDFIREYDKVVDSISIHQEL